MQSKKRPSLSSLSPGSSKRPKITKKDIEDSAKQACINLLRKDYTDLEASLSSFAPTVTRISVVAIYIFLAAFVMLVYEYFGSGAAVAAAVAVCTAYRVTINPEEIRRYVKEDGKRVLDMAYQWELKMEEKHWEK